MPATILDGLSLVDSTGRLILTSTIGTLVVSVGANLFVRARYRALDRDLDENPDGRGRFVHEVLHAIMRSSEEAARRSEEVDAQAIIETRFHTDLRSLLLGERFVRAATGLVIILGLLGTFYGLTSSIGRLVDLVAGDATATVDVTKGVTTGLTQALSGMAVAFSNSLVGIGSAIVLTILNVASSLSEQRVALMTRIETHVARWLAGPARPSGAPASGMRTDRLERIVTTFGESAERLESAVARFESALQSFSTSTRDFTEFNAHLKDNVQRMSLSFGDLSDTLKSHVVALRRGNGE
jgi:hypothetical protein